MPQDFTDMFHQESSVPSNFPAALPGRASLQTPETLPNASPDASSLLSRPEGAADSSSSASASSQKAGEVRGVQEVQEVQRVQKLQEQVHETDRDTHAHRSEHSEHSERSEDLDRLQLYAELNSEIIPEITPEAPPEASVLWERCLVIIRDNVAPQIFKTWFEKIQALRFEDDVFTIQVPSQFFYEWIEEHFFDLLQKTLAQVMGASVSLQYQVVVENTEEIAERRTIRLPAKPTIAAATQQSSLPFTSASPVPQNFPSFLNPNYVFENFIRGESNQLAAAAANAIAEKPGRTKYNPFVVYGSTGLGKTHLVQAIGNRALQANRNLRVLYTNSERFTMEYINAIQNGKLSDFTNFYRSIDILIVDDIQFFSGKEKTQDSFFHTFNALYQSGKQIILTSDKAPKEIHGVDERLISRFQWGLTADVQTPDFEMRMAILQRKAVDEGVEIPGEIVEYLARHVTSSVRELEGTLISLMAKVSLDSRELTLDLAREVVRGIAYEITPREITPKFIIAKVAEYYDIPENLLVGKTRKQEIVLARQTAMFIIKELTQLSLKSIGAHFGGRDHTTVIHSCQVIQNYLDTDPKMQQTLAILLDQIGAPRH